MAALNALAQSPTTVTSANVSYTDNGPIRIVKNYVNRDAVLTCMLNVPLPTDTCLQLTTPVETIHVWQAQSVTATRRATLAAARRASPAAWTRLPAVEATIRMTKFLACQS